MIVEVVAYSVNDCVNCQRVGVGRVELTSGIELGGLTPGIGLVKQVQAAAYGDDTAAKWRVLLL
jgi:copper homeostasis protein